MRTRFVFGVLCTALFGCGEDAGQPAPAGTRQVMSARPAENTPAAAGNEQPPAGDGTSQPTPVMSGTPSSGEQMPTPALTREQTTPLVYELQDITTSAIYELKGDALRMCLPPRLGMWQRPTSFKAEERSGETSYTLKRVRE